MAIIFSKYRYLRPRNYYNATTLTHYGAEALLQQLRSEPGRKK
jgi:hypothetical protein